MRPRPAEADLESQLVKVASYFPSDQDKDKTLAFVLTTRLYGLASARILTTNKVLYQRFYLTPIRALQALKAPTSDGNTKAGDLEKRLSLTSCDKCRGDAAAAVAIYNALRPAPVPAAQTATVTDASSVAAALSVAKERAVLANDSNVVNIERKLDALRATTADLVQTPLAAQADKAAKLKAATDAARVVLP